MEAAAAYYEVTGKDRLLHVMERMAEHIGKRLEQKKVKNRAFRDTGNRAGTSASL